jgi:hypothetical protein
MRKKKVSVAKTTNQLGTISSPQKKSGFLKAYPSTTNILPPIKFSEPYDLDLQLPTSPSKRKSIASHRRVVSLSQKFG